MEIFAILDLMYNLIKRSKNGKYRRIYGNWQFNNYNSNDFNDNCNVIFMVYYATLSKSIFVKILLLLIGIIPITLGIISMVDWTDDLKRAHLFYMKLLKK